MDDGAQSELQFEADSPELAALLANPELEAPVVSGVVQHVMLNSSRIVQQALTIWPPLFSHRERAVRRARTQLGYSEEPPGSNANKFSSYFKRGPQPWCADFVSWAFDSTGNRDRRLPWENPSAVQSLIIWAMANRRFANRPARGDIFVIKNASESHCGLVQAVRGANFSAIEGNTARKGDNRIIWVTERWRPIAKFRFIRVPHKAE